MKTLEQMNMAQIVGGSIKEKICNGLKWGWGAAGVIGCWVPALGALAAGMYVGCLLNEYGDWWDVQM